MSPNTLTAPDFAATETAVRLTLTARAGAVATRPEVAPVAEPAEAKEARYAILAAGLARALADTDAYFAKLVPYAPPLEGYPYIDA